MQNKPKVSIIIPVYNVEKYLRQCLDSVVNQTLKNIEIICIDDGSTDSSLEILKEYAQKDNRFVIVTQKNKHAGIARNRGIKLAKGEYLYFMDGDDYLVVRALEKIYKKIIDTNAEICVFKNDVYHQSTGELESCNWEHSIINIPNKETFNKYDISNVFFQFCNIPAWTKMYKTSFIKNNKLKFQKLRTCNDVYFYYISLTLANSITFLNETLLTWRTEHSCTTATRGEYIYCILKAHKAVKNKLSKKDFEILYDSFYKKAKDSFNYEIDKIDELKKRDFWTLKLYKFLPEKYWTKQEAISVKNAQIERKKNFVRNIFSIRNKGIHKVLTILGIKISFKRLRGRI